MERKSTIYQMMKFPSLCNQGKYYRCTNGLLRRSRGVRVGWQLFAKSTKVVIAKENMGIYRNDG